MIEYLVLNQDRVTLWELGQLQREGWDVSMDGCVVLAQRCNDEK